MTPRWSLLLLLPLAGIGLLPTNPTARTGDTTAPEKRIKRQYAAFLNLPPESQRRIRQLDRELREEDSQSRQRYLGLLQRYGDWYDRLDPQQRADIEQAPTPAAKLDTIRRILEDQWIANLAEVDRVAIQNEKTPEGRKAAIERIRERERQGDLDWQMTLARLEERQEMIRIELTRWRKQVLDKLSPLERKQREAEWRNLRQPGVIDSINEQAQKLNIKMPEILRGLRFSAQPVDNARLRQFMETNESVRREFGPRLRDPEQREQALRDLMERYWEEHADELRAIRERDELIKKRKLRN